MDPLLRSLRNSVCILLIILQLSEGFIHKLHRAHRFRLSSDSLNRKILFLSGALDTRVQSLTSIETSQLFAEASNNPLSSLVSDFAQSIMGKSDSIATNSKVDEALQKILDSASDNGSSWSDIRRQLESLQTPEESKFRENLAKGYGEGSPMHKVRLYDDSNSESDIRVTFYRDHASWCPYCQKVWFALEEKRIPYRVEKVNMSCYGSKPREFLQLQPNGQIPVAVIDGQVYGQSNDILAALDSLFPEHKSLLPPAGQETNARNLLLLERSLAGAWLGWLRSSGNSNRYKQNMEAILSDVEDALVSSGGPFFLGNDVSIVDVQFLSFLERICASLLYFKGFIIRVPSGEQTSYPAINRWFDALEKKPAYQLTKSDFYTHCWDLPPQLGGCGLEEEGEPYRKAINGERSLDGSSQGSWELPLLPHNGGIEPDWEWAGDEATAKREAVERMSFNHEAIVKFAARGAGKKGMPPVMAPLADPNAVPSEAVQASIDTVLRCVSLALLEGVSKQEDTIRQISEAIRRDASDDFVDGLVASLSYLRDRVGVPRDMKLPAARQLRAHLNWAIGKLL